MTALDRLEGAAVLDPVAERLRRWVRALPLGQARDALHGRWLGHPLHPALVQVPIGAWTSAAVLDLRPGQRGAAGTLVAVGLGGAAPAALAGWVDWAELHRQQTRVGLVHATFNIAAIGLYAGSLAARIGGRDRAGRLLGFAGLTAASAGGALGGHLSFRQASGANHAEEVPHLVPSGWQVIGELADLPVGEPVRRTVGEVPVLALREGDDTVWVLAERCSHLAGPLSEGEIVDGCVRCPWHGSTFRLSDGWNVGGPATAPQPAFDARVVDGRVQVRLREEPSAARSAGAGGTLGQAGSEAA
ncbi:Rieske (2Fe-2S) protein [Streptomyces sp. B6B3]|uniref:Rieske (2Fe-2S) protein n=1 Tax=Streptomyces sp. B6B3 TaxID=3153570 RepID=UPI00325F1ABE